MLDQVRDKLRVNHSAIHTETAYLGWIKRYVYFYGKSTQRFRARNIEFFLTHLAVAGKVSAFTQNKAKSLILFLYLGDGDSVAVAGQCDASESAVKVVCGVDGGKVRALLSRQ